MSHVLKIRRVGGSLGAIFPKELLEEMQIGEGQELMVLRSGRDFTLVPRNSDREKVQQAFEQFEKQYHNTLRRLAE